MALMLAADMILFNMSVFMCTFTIEGEHNRNTISYS